MRVFEDYIEGWEKVVVDDNMDDGDVEIMGSLVDTNLIDDWNVKINMTVNEHVSRIDLNWGL